MSHRTPLAVFLDIETSLESHNPPLTPKTNDNDIPSVYRIGISFREQGLDYFNLVKSDEKLSINTLEGSNFKTFDGKHCDRSFATWLKNKLRYYSKIIIYIYNASFDMKYLEPALIDVFGGEFYNSVLKDNDDMVYSQFDFNNRKTIKICDLFTFQRKSLKEILSQFKGCSKKSLPHIKKWMEYDNNGDIVGYWTFKFKGAEVIDNYLEKSHELIRVKWSDVVQEENEYLWYDVVPLYLVLVSIARIKKSIKEKFEEWYGYKLTGRECNRLYNKTNTSGEFYKFFCNLALYITFILGKSRYYTREQIEKGRNLLLILCRESNTSPYENPKNKDKPNLYKLCFQSELDTFDIDTFDNQNDSLMGALTTGTYDTTFQVSNEFPIGVACDMNSQYPYIMSGSMPVGNLRDKPLEGFENKRMFLCHLQEKDYIPIRCNWKPKYSNIVQSCIGNSVTKKYISKKLEDDRYLYLWERFYDVIHDMCENPPIIAFTKYKPSFPFLTEFINLLMKMKEESGKYKDTSLNLTELEVNRLKNLYGGVKLILNSGYGKMCEKPKKDTTKWCGVQMKYVPIEDWYKDREKTYDDNNIYDLMSGGYIPMNGKCELLNVIKLSIDSGCKFIYGDTDSVLLGLPPGVNIENIIPIHDTKMGSWKAEYTFIEFKYPLKSKKYMCYDGKKILIKYSGVKGKLMNKMINKGIDLIRTLYDKDENILIIDASNTTTVLDNKPVIDPIDKSFNSYGDTFLDHYGNKEERGVLDNTGFIYELDGEIHYYKGKFKIKK